MGSTTLRKAPARTRDERGPAHARGLRHAAAWARRPEALIAGLAALFYAIFVARTAFLVDGRIHFTLFDDAMVSMRYGRNLAEGAGLAWNPGQDPVEGYTNLLWTLWMGAVHLTGAGDALAPLVVMLSGAAILVVNLFAVRALVREIAPGRRDMALAAMAATALYYPLAYWTLRGMEVGLVALLTTLVVLYAVRLERAPDRRTLASLAAVMAAGVLTRDDVLIPCLVASAYVVLRCCGRRAACLLALGGAIAAAVAAHEAFRLLYYDSLLPNTYDLKMGGVALSDRVSRGAAALANVTWATLWVPAALAAAGLAARRGRRAVAAGPTVLMLAIVGALAAYSVYVGGDAWEFMSATNRFLTPAVPLLLVAACLGFATLADARPALPGRRALPALVALLAVGALHAAAGLAGHRVVELPQVPSGGVPGPRLEIAAALGAGLLAAAIALARSRSRPRLVWPAFAVALVVATSGAHLYEWRWENATYADVDARMARYGVHLREATAPGTSVAVAWGGAIPYFDRRPSVDLLGKSDRTIARERPHPGPLHPGHMKWDYDHSLGRLRPDVVAQLWRPSASDLALAERLGYEELAPPGARGTVQVYVRRDAAGVDRDRLRRALPDLLAEDE
ncbi:MAG TPA: hypothetical protein VF520_02585 [Thermoleophilaceae bacterium]